MGDLTNKLKKGKSLTLTFWPFNWYIKYIGRPSYVQGRRMGLSVYIALWFCPTVYSFIVCLSDLIAFNFGAFAFGLLLNNGIWFFTMVFIHRMYKKARFYNTMAIKMSREINQFDKTLAADHVRALNALENDLKAARSVLDEVKRQYQTNKSDEVKELLSYSVIKYEEIVYQIEKLKGLRAAQKEILKGYNELSNIN